MDQLGITEKAKYLAHQLSDMYFIKTIRISLLIFVLATSIINSDTKIEHKIAVIVNEDLITSYDIIQRMKLSAILQGININDQNNQMLLNNTVDELIHEKLKKEKINEYKIIVSEDEYLEFEFSIFERYKLDKDTLINLLETNNIKYVEFESLLKNELSWNKLINRLFSSKK